MSAVRIERNTTIPATVPPTMGASVDDDGVVDDDDGVVDDGVVDDGVDDDPMK